MSQFSKTRTVDTFESFEMIEISANFQFPNNFQKLLIKVASQFSRFSLSFTINPRLSLFCSSGLVLVAVKKLGNH